MARTKGAWRPQEVLAPLTSMLSKTPPSLQCLDLASATRRDCVQYPWIRWSAWPVSGRACTTIIHRIITLYIRSLNYHPLPMAINTHNLAIITVVFISCVYVAMVILTKLHA